ncbi:MAG: hypothetical protein RIC55_14395 [Pirellulaceae bacterium]
MAEHAFSFRDFGILPEDLPPPAETVRSYFSTGRVVGQYVGAAIVSGMGLGLTLLFALTMPLPMSLLACAAALVGFGTFVVLATRHDFRWVELGGDMLRAKHLYTQRVIERKVEEIESLGVIVYQVKSLETAVAETLLGRVKGVEIRFRDGRTPLRILRADPAMTNAKELIEAVLYRMGQLGELDAHIINLDGKPLVRLIHWKGETPIAPPRGKFLKVLLVCLIGGALIFGTILGYLGLQQEHLHVVGSKPPHEIAVAKLIQDGPGANRHVTLRDFLPGGYVVESKSSGWTTVWIALFPAGAGGGGDADEIRVVVSSKAIRNEAELQQLLQTGRFTGICWETQRTSWGTTLGGELIRANDGCPLSSAWYIEELRETPTAAHVQSLLLGSTACFTAVLVLSAVLFWRAS